MDIHEERIKLVRTKTGLPALWESGGSHTNTGSAQIITGPKGEMLTPVFISRKGSLACTTHALFIVNVGMLVIRAKRNRGGLGMTASRIMKIEGEFAIVEVINSMESELWGEVNPEPLASAARACKDKVHCWHCRSPHYCVDAPPHEIVEIKVTEEAEALLAGLRAGDDFISDFEEWEKWRKGWIGDRIFPFVLRKARNRPWDTQHWCRYFGIEVKHFLHWKWERSQARATD